MHPESERLVHLNTLKRYKLLLWILPLISTAIGVAGAFYIIAPKWEASAVLEVGQVAGKPVELSANTVTRMMHPSFVVNTLSLYSGESTQINLARNDYKTLKVSQVKGTELVELKLRSNSPNRAKNLIHNAIVIVQSVHSEMLAVTRERNIKQIQLLDQDIQSVTAELAQLRQKLTRSNNWNSFDATLVATVLQSKALDVRDMTQKKLLLEEQISPTRTYTTRVVGEIYVTEEPVSPNKLLIVALALMVGLVGAMVIAFSHNALTRAP